MSKLSEVFNSTTQEIERHLQAKVDDLKVKTKAKYFSKLPKIDKLQIQLADKKEEIALIQAQMREIETQIQNLDPQLSYDDANALFYEAGGVSEKKPYSSYNSVKKSQVMVDAIISNSTEVKNKDAWNKIKDQTRSQFILAITPKQQQQVILSLQNGVDWKALGINIPNIFEIQKVEIVKGAIILNNALPNKKDTK